MNEISFWSSVSLIEIFHCVGKNKSESCDKQSEKALQDRNKDLSGTL